MTIVFDDLEAPGGGIIFGDLDSIGELPEPWVLVVTPSYGIVQPASDIPFQLAKHLDIAHGVVEGQDVSLIYDENINYSLQVEAAEAVAEAQAGHVFPVSLLLLRATAVVSPRNVRLLWSERPAIPYSGRSITVAEISPSGLIQWVHYLPVTRVLLEDEDKINRFDDDGALAVRVLDNTTGLTPWVDYIPVVEVDRDPRGRWTYDDSGFLPVTEVTDP